MSKSILFFCFFVLLFSLLLGSVFVDSAKAQSETESFFIESSYDLHGRKEIDATLIRTSSLSYFYVEKSWWKERSLREQNDLRIAIFELSREFQNTIYPVLTSTFGSEPKPGIDGDERITILIHPMGQEVGGYFNSGDAYGRLQNPRSNEREMVYLNSDFIGKIEAKSFLAHEFMHVITVNQKNFLRRQTEEVWLNEARAEYAPTLLGYDDMYEKSNLQRRVRGFLGKPSNPLTEWFDRKEDYGSVNVFIQYMVDHYGVNILVDSLQSSSIGIASLNEALQKNGFEEDFTRIFSDWTIAILVNDCDLGARYCYKNKHLQELRITPVLYLLPNGETIFSTYHNTFDWSVNWHRLIGGGEHLSLEFKGADSANFEVPYVICDSQDRCAVEFISLDKEQKGTVTFSEFNTKYNSLTIVPFIVSNTSGSNGRGDSFSWQVTVQKELVADDELVRQFLVRISELQEQVRQLQARLALLLEVSQDSISIVSCSRLEQNLSFGVRGDQVRCLQEFLRAQDQNIYPEGLVTGNFLSLTRQAVIRFQEKYAPEILAPLGLNKGTGYVGQMTRNKVNQLMGTLVVN